MTASDSSPSPSVSSSAVVSFPGKNPEALPARASLENLRKQAKTLLKQRRASLTPGDDPPTLSGAQHELARRYGFVSWPQLVAHFKPADPADRVRREGGRVWIDGVPRLAWGRATDLTYLGALEAAFVGSDRPLDLTQLMGDSGLCFRLRWARENEPLRWCGSGPVGEWPEERAALNAATGYVFDWRYGHDTAGGAERVAAEIDAGRPILAYAIKHDVSLIYGYEDAGRRVVVRDYWATDDPHVMPIEDLTAITGWLTAIDPPAPRADAVRAGLALAIERWHEPTQPSEKSPEPHYHYGPNAYREWISDLRRAEPMTDEQRGNLYFLNGWTYCVLRTGRHDHAAKYLRANAGHLPADAAPHLEAAAACYDRAARRLGKWDAADPTFGFVKQKPADGWTVETRQREIALLEDLHALDAEAIGHLEQALVTDPAG
ncbi:MAG: hypothetical protein AAF333_11330 [Planctomycetota bacterium]